MSQSASNVLNIHFNLYIHVKMLRSVTVLQLAHGTADKLIVFDFGKMLKKYLRHHISMWRNPKLTLLRSDWTMAGQSVCVSRAWYSLLLCASELRCRPETIKNTHFPSLSWARPLQFIWTRSQCPAAGEYLLQNYTWIIPPLKVVPNKCPVSSCLFD